MFRLVCAPPSPPYPPPYLLDPPPTSPPYPPYLPPLPPPLPPPPTSKVGGGDFVRYMLEPSGAGVKVRGVRHDSQVLFDLSEHQLPMAYRLSKYAAWNFRVCALGREGFNWG